MDWARILQDQTEAILRLLDNPSVLGATPGRVTTPNRYELWETPAGHEWGRAIDPPARSLGEEMVMLGASLALPAARALPFAVRMGQRGVSALRALSDDAQQALDAFIQSERNRMGRDPTIQSILQALGFAPDVGINRSSGLGNPFRGRKPGQVDRMFREKGFDMRGSDPLAGKGGYVNPETKRSYFIDGKSRPVEGGIEYPHVDVHRPKEFRKDRYGGPLNEKRKWPLGDKLYDWE